MRARIGAGRFVGAAEPSATSCRIVMIASRERHPEKDTAPQRMDSRTGVGLDFDRVTMKLLVML